MAPPFAFSLPFQNPNTNNHQNPNPLHSLLSSFHSGAHSFLSSFCPAGALPSPLFSSFSLQNPKPSPLSPSVKVEERLEGIPVYALSSGADEFVLVSGARAEKSLGLFCFNRDDAEAILREMERGGAGDRGKVVPVALNKVFQLKIDGIAFRFVPDASQLKMAITEIEKGGESTGGQFPGVPVFQSKSLFIRSGNEKYRPVFFRKEDLDDSLAKALRNERKSSTVLKAGDVQVGVLEEMIKGMTDDSSNQWDDVVFIPPGFQMSVGQTESQN